MNKKHKKTLDAIMAAPMPKTLPFRDIEALLRGIGCRVVESRGSGVNFSIRGEVWYTHRPHPGKDALQYQIRGVKAFLIAIGVEA